jgi:putative tricarboxylic transport membrane protein
MTDVYITLIFGIFGYLFKKYDFERPPLVLAFVLGHLIENALRQSLTGSSGNFGVFITRPISATFLVIAMGIVLMAMFKKRAFIKKIAEDDN